jgi:hypothetical protein
MPGFFDAGVGKGIGMLISPAFNRRNIVTYPCAVSRRTGQVRPDRQTAVPGPPVKILNAQCAKTTKSSLTVDRTGALMRVP